MTEEMKAWKLLRDQDIDLYRTWATQAKSCSNKELAYTITAKLMNQYLPAQHQITQKQVKNRLRYLMASKKILNPIPTKGEEPIETQKLVSEASKITWLEESEKPKKTKKKLKGYNYKAKSQNGRTYSKNFLDKHLTYLDKQMQSKEAEAAAEEAKAWAAIMMTDGAEEAKEAAAEMIYKSLDMGKLSKLIEKKKKQINASAASIIKPMAKLLNISERAFIQKYYDYTSRGTREHNENIKPVFKNHKTQAQQVFLNAWGKFKNKYQHIYEYLTQK